jgi:glycosyltransferase involved in cell wall biosynthesis
MESKDLTVIIPAYNVAEYIGVCLESVLNNGGQESTIIVVDDGSQDDTSSIIKRFLNTNKNINFIQQSNGGQAVARNKAFRMTCTHLVTFVDADDFIIDDGISRLCAAALPDVDVVFSNRKWYSERTKIVKAPELFDDVVCGRMKDLKQPERILAPHGKVFRSSFLRENDIQFSEGMVWEDSLFSYKVALLAEKVTSISDFTYMRRRRSGKNKSTVQQLLTPYSLESRRRQLLQTAPFHSMPAWQARFGLKWTKREFGHHMLAHLKALVQCFDEMQQKEAFRTIRDIVLPYETQIRRIHTGKILEAYEAVFIGDLDNLKKIMN